MPSIDGRRITLRQSQSYKQQTCSVALAPASATERVCIFGIYGQGTQGTSEVVIADASFSFVNFLVASYSFAYSFNPPIFCTEGLTASVGVTGSGSSVCVSWGSQVG